MRHSLRFTMEPPPYVVRSAEQLAATYGELVDWHLSHAGYVGTIQWIEGGAKLVIDYEAAADASQDQHQALVNAVLQAAEQAGLSVAEAMVTTAVRTWAVTGASGALGSLGVTKKMDATAQFLGMLVAAVAGAAFGWFVKVDVPLYQVQRTSWGGWQLVAVPFGQSAPIGVGWAT